MYEIDLLLAMRLLYRLLLVLTNKPSWGRVKACDRMDKYEALQEEFADNVRSYHDAFPVRYVHQRAPMLRPPLFRIIYKFSKTDILFPAKAIISSTA